MPPPTSPDWASSMISAATRRQRAPTRPALGLISWERDYMDTDLHILRGLHFPESDSVGNMLTHAVASSQESDSEYATSTLSDISPIDQDSTVVSAIRRQYVRRLDVDLATSSLIIAAAQDILLSVSHDSDMFTGFPEDREHLLLVNDVFSTSDLNLLRSPQFQEAIDAQPVNSGLRASRDHTSTHRFLLTSASQDLRNGNSDDDMPYARRVTHPAGLEATIGAVPLRRQNAIRRVPSSFPTMSHDLKVNSLQKLLENLFDTIRAHDPFFGESPLFADSHLWNTSMYPLSRRFYYKRDKSILENNMNYVLLWRKSRENWKKNVYACELKGNVLRKVGSKRRYWLETSPSRKRKKTRPSLKTRIKGGKLPDHRDRDQGDQIYKDHLSCANKIIILNGLTSSLLNNGSKFSVAYDPILPSLKNVLELTMIDVCHESSRLSGFFQPISNKNDEVIFQLKALMNFLVGDLPVKGDKLLRDLLSELFECLSTSQRSGAIERQHLTLRIPFSGALVNFKDQDLRFKKEIHEAEKVPGQTENDHILSQMSEWLKIRPFSHLAEAFFVNRLKFAIRSLESFLEIPKKDQKSIFDFCRNMIDESWFLTKDFSLIRLAQIPVVEKSLQMKRCGSGNDLLQENASQLKQTYFTGKWNYELCERLAEFAGCADSCLLNLQLNYIIFTVKVDIIAAVSGIFNEISRFLPPSFQQKFMEQIEISSRVHKSEGSKYQATLVCSLDRKTGQLELLKVQSTANSKIQAMQRRYSAAHGSINNRDLPLRNASNPRSVSQRQQKTRLTFDSETNILYGLSKGGSFAATSWKDENGFLEFV